MENVNWKDEYSKLLCTIKQILPNINRINTIGTYEILTDVVKRGNELLEHEKEN